MRGLLLATTLLLGGCRCVADFPDNLLGEQKVTSPDRARLDARQPDAAAVADRPPREGSVDSLPRDRAADKKTDWTCSAGSSCTSGGGTCKTDNFCEIDCNNSGGITDCKCPAGVAYCRLHCHGKVSGGCTKSASCAGASECQVRCSEDTNCPAIYCERASPCTVGCGPTNCNTSSDVFCSPSGGAATCNNGCTLAACTAPCVCSDCKCP